MVRIYEHVTNNLTGIVMGKLGLHVSRMCVLFTTTNSSEKKQNKHTHKTKTVTFLLESVLTSHAVCTLHFASFNTSEKEYFPCENRVASPDENQLRQTSAIQLTHY